MSNPNPSGPTSTTLTIDQLRLSQFNVRTNQIDANATSALEESIRHRGLILPLVVHPMRGAKTYGVFAGGRRYRSIRALVDRGELPADYPVHVVIRDLPEAELIEVSVAENMLRRKLREYETFAAVARAHRKGDSVRKIADTLGQEIVWVRKALRLGSLAEPIFRALEADQISVEDARAYAATEDHALQLATFEAMQELPEWQRTDAKIRAWMRVGDLEASRTLRFVGDRVYRDAGGRFELDLFADGEAERGRIVDDELLRRLADEKLNGLRDETRRLVGRPDLRFVPQPPRCEYGTDYTLQVTPRPTGEGNALALPDGAIVATIVIPDGGEPEVQYWWESRKAKHGSNKPEQPRSLRVGRPIGSAIDDRASPGATQEANAAIREEEGISQETVQVFRSLRRAILREAIVADAATGGDVGRDFLVWSQLRLLLGRDGRAQIGAAVLTGASHDPDSAQEHVAALPGRRWAHALYELQQQTFMTRDDLGEAFLDYRASGALKNLAVAVVAGLALERSLNADGYRLPTHDTLAAELGLHDDGAVRALWRPTATLLDRVPTKQLLAIAEPFVEQASFAGWSRLKSAQVTERVTATVTDGAVDGVRPAAREAAARWVHPLLRFEPQGEVA